VKPSRTDRETKSSRLPSRAAPMTIWMSPANPASQKASSIKGGVPGGAMVFRELKTTREMAVVGPVIRWAELPHRQATRVGTIEEYRPYCTGRPAIRA
jgi:hypothetical protein